jgi:hypothetical protein
MAIAFYMDHNVAAAITSGLRSHGVSVLTALEDAHARASDSDLLSRATELDRVLFSQDRDLLAEAAHRQARGSPFSGLIYAHQLRVSIGRCIADLEIIAKVGKSGELVGRIVYLPL